MLRRAIVFAACSVAGCASETDPMPAVAPPVASSATTDPIRSAMMSAGSYFRRPQANRPAEAARAIANMEFLAEAVPRDPRWQAAPAQALTQLQTAKNEGRSALGIPGSASPQSVISGLMGAASAIDAGDRAALAGALPNNVFTGGPEGTVRRLSQPPRIPSAAPALLSMGSGGETQR
jgi:hypothetical protein